MLCYMTYALSCVGLVGDGELGHVALYGLRDLGRCEADRLHVVRP